MGEMVYRRVRDRVTGELYTVALAINNKTGEEYWARVEDPMAGRLSPKPSSLGYKRIEDVPEEGDLPVETNPQALARINEVKRMPWFNANDIPFVGPAAIAAGHPLADEPSQAAIEFGKVGHKFGVGLSNFGDFLSGIVLPGTEYGEKLQKRSMDRYIERAKNEAENDRVMAQFDENGSFIPKMLGGMGPYLLTQRFAGPVANKAAASLTGAVEDVAATAANEGKSLLGKAAEKAPGWLGETLRNDYYNPIQAFSTAVKARPPMPMPGREGVFNDILAGTLLGAAEGGIRSDTDLTTGAIGGAFGSTTGNILKPYLSRAKLPEDPSYNQALKDVELRGYRVNPGERLANEQLQSEYHAMGSHNQYSPLVRGTKSANQVALNRMAYQAMGLFNKDWLKPEELRAHVAKLGDEFNSLEASTPIRLERADIQALERNASKYFGKVDAEGEQAYKLAQQYATKAEILRQSQLPQRAPNGRMMPGMTDTKDWLDLRNEVRDKLFAARTKGDTSIVAALTPIRDLLDNAVLGGVAKSGGTVEEGLKKLAAFKDLRERYAMAKILEEHGLDSLGSVDPNKLDSYFRVHDNDRYMTMKGGRVKDLYRIARLSDVSRKQAGSNMSGLNMHEAGVEPKNTENSLLLSTPADDVVPLTRSLKYKAYMAGYPRVTGLLGLDGQGFANVPLYTRAADQASGAHAKLWEGIQEGYDMATHPGRTFDRAVNAYYQYQKRKRKENGVD